MKVRVVMNIEVDQKLWAQAAGLNPPVRAKDVVDDVKTYVLTATQGLAMIEEADGEVELTR